MYLISNISSDAQQSQTLTLPDGSTLTMQLYYNVSQIGWFMTLSWGSFQLKNFRICNSPNMLNQYRNQLNFGLLCLTVDPREPTQILDFSTGVSQLYILDASEVDEYQVLLQGSS
jgi:hypothetical protein